MSSPRKGPAALLVSAMLLLGPGPVVAATAAPQASLTSIEDQVMCPICGTLLELSQAPQANRERVFIRRLIAHGESEAQIKDALVAQYGPNVLATPRGSGFDLSAYWVPVLCFVVAAAAIAFALRRWRRQTPQAVPATTTEPSPEEAERLKADLARYDL